MYGNNKVFIQKNKISSKCYALFIFPVSQICSSFIRITSNFLTPPSPGEKSLMSLSEPKLTKRIGSWMLIWNEAKKNIRKVADSSGKRNNPSKTKNKCDIIFCSFLFRQYWKYGSLFKCLISTEFSELKVRCRKILGYNARGVRNVTDVTKDKVNNIYYGRLKPSLCMMQTFKYRSTLLKVI